MNNIKIKATYFDVNPQMCAAWEKALAGHDKDFYTVTNCRVSDLPPHDYIISAGNSYGIMSGGVDYYVRELLGQRVQDALQFRIVYDFDGKLPVGSVAVVRTGNPSFPNLVYAPTMETPRPIDAENVYSAYHAAIVAVLKHAEKCGLGGEDKTVSVACPGLGTGCGGVPFTDAAMAMERAGWLESARELSAV